MNHLRLINVFKGSKVFFFVLLLYVNPAFSQTGWDKKIEDNLTIYIPQDLALGETVFHFVLPPQRTSGHSTREILLSFVEQVEKEITGRSGEWAIKKSKIGDFFASKIMPFQGKTLMFVFHVVSLPNDNYYIIQTIVDNDTTVMKKYMSRLRGLVKEIGDPTHTSRQTVAKRSVPDSSVRSKKPVGAKVMPPKGLKEIRGTMEYGIQSIGTFGLTGKVVALFDDESFTRDLGVVFDKGTERAKKENPEIWGKWRIKHEKLELKDFEDEEFGKTHGSWVAAPGKENMKLEGCYGNMTSSSGGAVTGISKGQASSWCFNSDGRFAYGVSGYGTHIFDINTKRKDKSLAGYYRIDKYAAHFVFDDGTEITAAFCFLDDEREHIAINGKRLMLNF